MRWFDLRPPSSFDHDGVSVRVTTVRKAHIDVGSGLRPENLGRLSELARRVREFDTVEIVGDTDKAAHDALALLDMAWSLDK
jgi:hypothetical protein